MNKIELCDYKKCTQCYACQNACNKGCIDFVDSNDGFKIPEIDRERCLECGACMKVCHQITTSITYKKPLKTYACWTKNNDDRANSSSGGAFSVFAKKVLSNGGVVFGASMCEDLKVRHIAIEKVEEIIQLQGSKYLQSYLGDTYKQVKKELQTGRVVLFTGTPCQVGGLLTFLKKPYDNLLTCDVVCHGVPSQKAFDIYIDKIGIRNITKNFNFRFTEGWGYRLSRQTVSPKDGDSVKKIISPKKSYYIRAFTNGLMFDESCYTCHYARPERVSNFTIADYWGLGFNTPFNHSTLRGVSCLLVNDENAQEFLEGCEDLFWEERPLEEAITGNYNLSHTSSRPEGRDTFYEDSQNLSISELSKKYKIESTLRDYLRIVKQKFEIIKIKYIS